jgi:heme/copper-type cytochrome/quinol oxidase subunit 1
MPGLYGGLGNYFIIIFIGNLEIIYSRINNISIILITLSIFIILTSIIIEFNIGIG